MLSKLQNIFLASIIVLAACSKENKGNVIAEAFGKKLYDTDLATLINENTTFEDSVFIAKEFIHMWLSQQVLLNQAESTLSLAEKDKTAALEQYKNDLLVYEVLNKLSLNELDTSFSEGELDEYYNDNLEEFELSQNIIKVNFFKIQEDSKDKDLLWSNFKENDESIYGKLIQLAKNGGNYYVDKSNWVNFDDILKEVPINTYNQEHYLNNNKYIQLNEGKFVYFIKIIDFKIRSTTSPFEMEKENIKNILLVKRQEELIKSIETKLVDEAYSDNKVKIY